LEEFISECNRDIWGHHFPKLDKWSSWPTLFTWNPLQQPGAAGSKKKTSDRGTWKTATADAQWLLIIIWKYTAIGATNNTLQSESVVPNPTRRIVNQLQGRRRSIPQTQVLKKNPTPYSIRCHFITRTLVTLIMFISAWGQWNIVMDVGIYYGTCWINWTIYSNHMQVVWLLYNYSSWLYSRLDTPVDIPYEISLV